MALKSSFKCNFKPYWLLKEREENIPPSVAGAGGSDPVDGARKAFGIFTSAPGHSFKQCARRFFSTGQPWARLGDAGFPVPSAAGSTLCPAALARVGCRLRKAGSVRGQQAPRSTETAAAVLPSPPAARGSVKSFGCCSCACTGISPGSRRVSLGSGGAPHGRRQGWGVPPTLNQGIRTLLRQFS